MHKVVIAIGMGLLVVALCLTGIQAQTLCPNETERNNEYYVANPVDVPGCILGTVGAWINEEGYLAGDNDCFVIETTVGRRYTLNLAIDSPQGLNVRMSVFDADCSGIVVSWASSTWVTVSFVATTDITYIRVFYSLSSLPELPATAAYRLDVSTVYRVLLPMVWRGH